jgi:hypothetical protein
MKVNRNMQLFTQGIQGTGDSSVTSAVPIRLEIASRLLAGAFANSLHI